MKIWVKRAPKLACALAACSALLALNACGSGADGGSAASAIQSFAAAIDQQDAGAAAKFTTAPGQAGAALQQTLEGMHAEKVDMSVVNPVEYSDGTASFSLKTTWHWAEDREFETTSSGTARHLSTGWKITWEPSVIYPNMPTGGSLREIRTDATPAPKVLSTSGKTFMYQQPVNEIVLDPARTTNLTASVRALARTLAPIAPLITADVISKQLTANPGKPITAVILRDPDMTVLESDPGKVPGVSVHKSSMLLMKDRRLSSPLEDGLTNYWQAILDATAGWQVQLVGPGLKPRKLAGEQGPPGPNVNTTIDQNLQLTLGDAAVEVGQPATILALDASSGAILGMARNSYAVDRGINVDGVYRVGSSLDPVLSAIDKAATDGQARGDLIDRLGLGVQFTVAGASTPTDGQPGVATVDFRSGDVNASMMNMGALGVALARSSKGQLSSVAPYVVKGVPTTVSDGDLGQLPAGLVQPILKAMSVTAATGDASDLTGAPGLRALVGTNGPQGPGWFVGVQGGKVIVIYCEGERSGTAALQVAQKYFRIK
ncbi:NTF2-like N-terminal transpeptidase domain-containing protein [Gordonia rhizosphera]|uniref:Putative penicillin-binding protein n=1 Tax=Gordonia rhizosphera NBRC 16068 TaxID=1108045 RepID=K6VRH2_9ACTN|nr:NTF2-like N-terminal transpeptidase domain-containing protein [Gordonia rhizosphera]GAB89520.1 putative penicillin-binding protein [Gordonia rhizosphera NBRC 16068]